MKLTIDNIKTILKSPYKEPILELLKLVKLDNREQKIIDYYYFQGLKKIEIADKIGITERALYNVFKKAENKIYKVWCKNPSAIAMFNTLNS